VRSLYEGARTRDISKETGSVWGFSFFLSSVAYLRGEKKRERQLADTFPDFHDERLVVLLDQSTKSTILLL